MDSDFQPRPSKRTARSQTDTDENENFQPPETVAARDDAGATPPPSSADDAGPSEEAPLSPKPHKKWRPHWPTTRKGWVILITLLILLLLAACGISYAILHKSTPETAQPIQKATSKTVPSTLTGLPVDPSVNKRTVTGVMIENSPQARPQSGLGQAGVVFEAIAEGGITRFLALYQDTAPDNVGPIRSARPYYEQWALGFDAGYAHVGGSPEALADIKAWHVRDLDQFYNSGSYHRISSRAAPHNVYTSISTLNQLEVQKGYTTSTYTGFKRKPKENPSPTPTARSINFALSGPTYDVHYDYDAKTNSYLRNLAGAPHIDANTNQQINPKVVIALIMPYSLESDGYHSDYGTIGSGPVYVFQDGGVTHGKWTKSSNTDQFKFTDDNGRTILLDPGYTWLTALADTSKISYSP